MSPPLRASGIGKTYGAGTDRVHEVIADVSFELGEGEIVSIVGPSGCGKTTLLNMLCGVTPLSRGSVAWHGRPLSGMPDRVGYMLQKDLLLPWRTAAGNVMLGLEVQRMMRRDRRLKAQAMLQQVNLGSFHDYYPSALSGGMRQRVALARTLATDPDVLLLDEPFAALDFQTKLLIENDTLRLVRGGRRSLLMITHDVEEAVSLSDRVLVLSHRPSRIKSVHEIDLGEDRMDVIAARQAPGFHEYVRAIWSELEVRAGEG